LGDRPLLPVQLAVAAADAVWQFVHLVTWSSSAPGSESRGGKSGG
jgi:hypothetical protein